MAEEQQGDHSLCHKHIKRLPTRGATSTKQLLNAGGGLQIPRRATQSLGNEVGQNIKTKKETKNSGKETPSWEGSSDRGEVSSE